MTSVLAVRAQMTEVWLTVRLLAGGCQKDFWGGGAGRDRTDSCGLCHLRIPDADAPVLSLEPHLCHCAGEHLGIRSSLI